MSIITGTGNFPGDEGVPCTRNNIITFLGGTGTPAGEVQVQDSEGGWEVVPDADNLSTLSGSAMVRVLGGVGLRYRINITNVGTGTWTYRFHNTVS